MSYDDLVDILIANKFGRINQLTRIFVSNTIRIEHTDYHNHYVIWASSDTTKEALDRLLVDLPITTRLVGKQSI